MPFLLDTNVVSEVARSKCAPRVAAWLQSQDPAELFLSAITIGELVRGIEKLGDGTRRRSLTHWLFNQLLPEFEVRILPVDEVVAERWGHIKAHTSKRGKSLSDLDGLIAATALTHGIAVATRNVSDLGRAGAIVVNPWQ